MDLMQRIIAHAKADKQRIVLPEGTEERTLKAADRLIANEVADIILVGNPAEINQLATEYGLKNIGKATIVDPKNHAKKQAYADLLFQLRQKKGMTPLRIRGLPYVYPNAAIWRKWIICLCRLRSNAESERSGTGKHRFGYC